MNKEICFVRRIYLSVFSILAFFIKNYTYFKDSTIIFQTTSSSVEKAVHENKFLDVTHFHQALFGTSSRSKKRKIRNAFYPEELGIIKNLVRPCSDGASQGLPFWCPPLGFQLPFVCDRSVFIVYSSTEFNIPQKTILRRKLTLFIFIQTLNLVTLCKKFIKR